MTACNPSVSNDAPTTEPDIVTTGEPVTEPPTVPITIFTGSTTQYTLVSPGSAGTALQRLVTQFKTQLSKRSGVTFDLQTDAATWQKEILLGNTNRPESTLLQQKLEALGGDRFGIRVTENTVAITGSNVYQLYLAMDYFMGNYITTSSAGTAQMVLPLGMEYISDPDSGLSTADIPDLLENHAGMTFSPVKTIIHVPNEDNIAGTQGCGFDGTYVYVGKIDNSTNQPEQGKLYKYRLDTGALVAVSQLLPTNHTNDITYDPSTGLLIVVGSAGSGNYMGGKLLTFVDPDTLTVVKSVTAPVYIRGLEYNPTTCEYIAAGKNYTFYRMDKDFNILSSFQCQNPNDTVQGLYTDGTYIYDPRFYRTNSNTHYMMLYTVDGQLIGRVPMEDLLGNEPEGMFMANGKYYLCCGWTHNVYEMEMLPYTYWPN